MIYLFTALRIEAEPWLVNAVPQNTSGPFPVYASEDVLLTITGTGPLSASAAVASILATHKLSPQDQLIHCGIAAGVTGAATGQTYRIHKITDYSSRRDYYPDLLIPSSLPEASLISGSLILSSSSSRPHLIGQDLQPFLHDCNETVLYDMEAAGVFHAASQVLAPHQIHCFKIVSDQGDVITPQEAAHFASLLHDAIVSELPAIRSAALQESPVPAPDTQKLAEDLNCSVTMERQLKQLIRYCQLADIPWQAETAAYYADGRLPVSSREEGKRILKEMFHALLK